MPRKTLLIIAAASIIALGAACSAKNENVNNNSNDDTYAPVDIDLNENENTNSVANTNSNTNSSTNSNKNSNTNTNKNSNVNDSADDETEGVSDGTLVVNHPEANDDLDSPFRVDGKSQASQVFVSVKSSSGATLFTIPVTVRSGAFSVDVTFSFSNTSKGSVVVFEKDSNGTVTNSVEIDTTFKVAPAVDDTNGNSNTNDNTNSENENVNS